MLPNHACDMLIAVRRLSKKESVVACVSEAYIRFLLGYKDGAPGHNSI